jgi:hypothetical protein
MANVNIIINFWEMLICALMAHVSDPKKEIFNLNIVYLIHFLNSSPINYTNLKTIFLLLDS